MTVVGRIGRGMSVENGLFDYREERIRLPPS